MKIDSYALDFSSQHSARSELQLQESLRIWVGQRPPEAGQGTRPPQELAIGTHIMGSLVQLSAAGRAAQAADNGNLDPATNRRNGTDLRQHLQELPAEAGLRRGQGLINAAANFSNSANTANTAPRTAAGRCQRNPGHERCSRREQQRSTPAADPSDGENAHR